MLTEFCKTGGIAVHFEHSKQSSWLLQDGRQTTLIQQAAVEPSPWFSNRRVQTQVLLR